MYHYEVLDDERFQQFCQGLIVASFPNAQCMPVGQPDGGRDAFLFEHLTRQFEGRNADPDVIVYQVKFIRNPNDSRSERDMIEEVVRSEKDKILKLKARGLKKYYLITNLKGTSHLDVGSIDKVNAALSEALGIEAYCWWRDDLDRRLDLHSALKWSYPDILKATDLLEKLVAGQLGEDEERRRSAIRAYMTAQYEDDQELKFKQTELRSTMADLFVDLPMRRSFSAYDIDDLRIDPPLSVRRHYRQWAAIEYNHYRHDSLLAAAYFIGSRQDVAIDRIVLEGAPGQGKSTVTQYVCQVLRLRLIGKALELEKLPAYCGLAMVRIPFRVDLRDLAKWISGVDPFQPPSVPLADNEPRSLEGFLAGQVRSLSGGHTFSVSDLTAVAKASHLLLALDGFDEVADIDLRQRLVLEIGKGANRLANAGTFSVQTIVTSRPAAFAKSVRFPHETWTYYELLPLERRNVDEYTAKWMMAKGLKETEKAQIRQILNTKLQESHTQYLAKNPMQLTILLSLIASRGPSLPEKRTAMYDLYMEMFFSRETEKSEVVREYRDLLIDIHRYLAWRLQTSAEGGGNGSIDQMALRTSLYEYLFREGEDATIVDALFDGMIERVGALVSRVQGTFEFEVQPLREYFAARHLYETAPYPAIASEVAGDKLDRFNALVRNPYWLNVARFYGGCFNKGEIMTLVNELMELADASPLEHTSHPRSFALMLLNDWVFTQYQPAVKAVLVFITKQPHFLQLLANADDGATSPWTSLPERSGRREFLEALWDYAAKAPTQDQLRALSAAIVPNTTSDERWQGWLAMRGQIDPRKWANFASMLELMQPAVLKQLDALGEIQTDLLNVLLRAQRFELLNGDPVFALARDELLHGLPLLRADPSGDESCRVQWLARTVSYSQYTLIYSEDDGLPLHESMARRLGYGRRIRGDEPGNLNRAGLEDLPVAERAAAEAYLQFIAHEVVHLATNLEPWQSLVARLRDAWGDCAAIDRIAFLAAGVRNSGESGLPAPFASTPDLVETARYARLKSGAPRWWSDQLTAASGARERRRLLLLLQMWGTPKTLLKLVDTLESILGGLPADEWVALDRDFQVIGGRLRGVMTLPSNQALARQAPRLCVYLGSRLDHAGRFALAGELARSTAEFQAPERNFVYRGICDGMRFGMDWEDMLPKISELYLEGCTAPLPIAPDATLSQGTAERVSRDPAHYPLSLVARADSTLRSLAGAETSSLGEVAERDQWFKLPC
ncbi:hypothetical protein WG901_21215 [Novosphingobium sp. PS1R-30]|uniref:NACHT domain-containing protein n=1 Tax=Novosphingobium anseongense TaxID=3133436 RepID=A0ABU8S1G5_9SPHN